MNSSAKDTLMMSVAKKYAKQSYSNTGKEGAVLELNGQILGASYNGTIKGSLNICEEHSPCSEDEPGAVPCPACKGGTYTYGYTFGICPICDNTGFLKPSKIKNKFYISAPINVISYCARKGISVKGSSLYVTRLPKLSDIPIIAQAGIKAVYYHTAEVKLGVNSKKTNKILDFLEDCNMRIEKL